MTIPKMNTREIGRELEQYISNKLQEIGYPNARPSKNSGCKGLNLGDIAGQDFTICECKVKNTKNITIKADVWKKLKESIPLHSQRIPIYALQNENKDRLVVLDVDDFFRLLKEKK